MIILLNARITDLDHHASSKYFKLLFYIANVYSQILLSLYFFLRFILFVFMVCVSTHRCHQMSWNWSHRCGLGPELGTSGRKAIVLKH